VVIELEQALDERGPHARVARRQRRNLERKHEPHGRVIEQRPSTGGVRKHDVRLQLLELVGRDARLGEAPEAGVDAVGGLARSDDALNRFVSRAQRRQAGRVELQLRAFPRNMAQGGEGEGCAADLHPRNIGRSRPLSFAQAIASS
jgi:hypothetical protein